MAVISVVYVQKTENEWLYPYSCLSQSPSEIIEFNGLSSLEWSQICTTDFWLVGLYCIHTEEMMLGKRGWIKGDGDKAWFNILDRAVLNLIRQYAIMAVDLTDMDFYLVFH